MYIAPKTTINLTISPEYNGFRIDIVLPLLIPGYSRSFFQRLIESSHITLNGTPVKKHHQELKTGDTVAVYFPENPATQKDLKNVANLGVQVIFEHEQFLIINKPAGLVVHAPCERSMDITLVDWLVNTYPDIATVGPAGRAGIVHRLDKDTSGIMIIPRTAYSLSQFGTLFKDRKIQKTYHAIVEGHPPKSGHIDYPIDRDRTQPTRMSHLYGTGRDALTYYTLLEQFKNYALLELKPVTGRTHQIRVHCAAIGHPLVGDATYGKLSPLIDRHALHAESIAFTFDGISYSFNADYPADFSLFLMKIR